MRDADGAKSRRYVRRVRHRADMPERALRFGAMEIVAPGTGGWPAHLVEQHEHVRRHAGETRDLRALCGGPHLEVPVDGPGGIDGVEADVVQLRHRRATGA